MRRLFCIVATMFLVATIQAQKIDARLTGLLPADNAAMSKSSSSLYRAIDTAAVQREINVSFNHDGTVKSFSAIAMVKEGYGCPTAKLQALGIEIRQEIGRMLILNVPAEKLLELGRIEEIESVSADQMNQLMNNHGREKSKVSEVATAEKALSNGLPQAYTGKGVIVGIIDMGIDYNHAAFRNDDGSTRLKMAIKYTGFVESSTYTDATEIAELTTDLYTESHGTHVAGIAAGSIVRGVDGSMLDKQGMAPEADIILCGMGNIPYDSNILEAIKKIFEYAKSQGKPCVINCSMGNVANFHDGIASWVMRGVKEYYKTESNKKGLICVFSAGNSAGHNTAICTTMPAADDDGYNLRTILGETSSTWHDHKKVNYYSYLDNFFYNTDGSEFDVDVKVVDVTTGEIYTLKEKPLYTALDEPYTSINKSKDIFASNNKHYVRFQMNDSYLFHEPNLKLAYFVKGTEGKTFRAIDKREEESAGYFSYGMEGYTDGGDDGAFNMHICGEEVIGVGAYVSEASWTPIGSTRTIHYPDETLQVNGGIASYSSWGTDDNGVNHPDVIAPGSAIMSAYNIHDRNFFEEGTLLEYRVNHITDTTTLFGRNHYYGVLTGTSMAAPNVTGVIALWLQANPDLTYADVRSLIQETSYNDEYTMNADNIPSKSLVQAGAGKIDALMGLQKITGATAIATVEADGFRQATPATMYYVDDNCYNALGQRVNKNAKGIVIYKGKVYVNR